MEEIPTKLTGLTYTIATKARSGYLSLMVKRESDYPQVL